MPTPRKLNADSRKIRSPIVIAKLTTVTEITFGMMCTNIMWRSGAPTGAQDHAWTLVNRRAWDGAPEQSSVCLAHPFYRSMSTEIPPTAPVPGPGGDPRRETGRAGDRPITPLSSCLAVARAAAGWVRHRRRRRDGRRLRGYNLAMPTPQSMSGVTSWAGIGSAWLLASLLAGCVPIGPRSVPADQVDYADAISEASKRLTLTNIVKTRYGDATSYLVASQVVAGYQLQANVAVNARHSARPLSVEGSGKAC